jgi:hypothetical protein
LFLFVLGKYLDTNGAVSVDTQTDLREKMVRRISLQADGPAGCLERTKIMSELSNVLVRLLDTYILKIPRDLVYIKSKKAEVVPVLNWTHQEVVLGSGGIAPRILWPRK